MAKKLNIKAMKPIVVFEPVPKGDTRFIRCKVLIVCEGEKTEPNYFRSFNMMNNSSGLVYEVSCAGGRISTVQVVDRAIALKDEAIASGNPYDSVWAVFDKDDFRDSDFDNAINKGEAHGINCAWSNEAFELWYVYHFDARSTAMKRSEYKKIINTRVNDKGYKNGNERFSYKKNDPDMRRILSACQCDESIAIQRAKQQADSFEDYSFHSHNPCTMVYKLVNLLIGKDKKFNDLIRSQLKKR